MFQRATRRKGRRAEASLGVLRTPQIRPSSICTRKRTMRETRATDHVENIDGSLKKRKSPSSDNTKVVSRCLGKARLPPAFPPPAAIYYRRKAGPANSPGPLGVDTGHPRREETFTRARNPARTTRSAYVNAASSQPPRPAGLFRMRSACGRWLRCRAGEPERERHIEERTRPG